MTNYYINEAILSFSGNISQDSTLNMIRLSDPDAALIISRGKMQDGDELASQVEQQMKKLEKQVKELRYTPAQVVRLGIDGKMEGLEIQSQFIRGISVPGGICATEQPGNDGPDLCPLNSVNRSG